MQLLELEIKRERWGENKGSFVGTARFDSELGEVGVILSPEAATEIVRMCASAVVARAKEVADAMVLPVLEHSKINRQTSGGGDE